MCSLELKQVGCCLEIRLNQTARKRPILIDDLLPETGVQMLLLEQ
jgi:hypothetical protein